MPVQKRVSSTVPIFCLIEPSDQIRSTVIGSEFLLDFTFQPLSQKHSNLLVLKRTAFKCASRQLYPKKWEPCRLYLEDGLGSRTNARDNTIILSALNGNDESVEAPLT